MNDTSPTVTPSEVATWMYLGFAVGAIIFILALLALIRSRKAGNWVLAVISFVAIFIPFAGYLWAVLYLGGKLFMWFTDKVSAPPSECGVRGCVNGFITTTTVDGQTSTWRCRARGYHGNL